MWYSHSHAVPPSSVTTDALTGCKHLCPPFSVHSQELGDTGPGRSQEPVCGALVELELDGELGDGLELPVDALEQPALGSRQGFDVVDDVFGVPEDGSAGGVGVEEEDIEHLGVD